MFITRPNPDNSVNFYFIYENVPNVKVFIESEGWAGFDMFEIEDGVWNYLTAPQNPGECSYKFLVNNSVWSLDQFNFRTWLNRLNSQVSIANKRGNIYKLTFFSTVYQEERSFIIYLPPSYFVNQQAIFPTLYLLSDIMSHEDEWFFYGGLEGVLNSLISHKEIGEFIVVIPEAKDILFHPSTGNAFEFHFIADLMGYVEQNFRSIESNKFRAIDGIGNGGYASYRIGLIYPDIISSIGSMSGVLKKDLYEIFKANLKMIINSPLRFSLNCGKEDADVVQKYSWNMFDFLHNNGFNVELFQEKGKHDWLYWRSNLAGMLKYHWHSFLRFSEEAKAFNEQRIPLH